MQKWFGSRGVGLGAALLLLVTMLSSATMARATTPIQPTPCLRLDSGDLSEAMLFDAPAPLDCGREQTAHGAGNFWVLLQGFSAKGTPNDPLVLRTASVWQDAVTLHIRYADGYVSQLRATSDTTSRLIRPGAFIEYPLPARAAPITAILAYVEGSANVRGVLFAPEILTRDEAATRDLRFTALYAAFLGLCLALLCYNFAMWTVMRRRFQLAYCAMVVTMMAYAVSSSGGLIWLWPDIDNNDRLRINYALLTLVVVAAIAFVRHFFEARIFPAWLLAMARVATIASLLATSIFVVAAPWNIALLDPINSVALAILLGCALPMLGYAAVRRSRFFTVLIVAWSAPFAFGVIRIVANLNLIPPTFWIDNSTVLAMSAEALLSAIAIAYRIRLLSEERDGARASETLARLIADTDPLTGLPNRRSFLSAVIGMAEPQRLMLVRVDNFLEINQRIGHDGGDAVLRCVAQRLRHFAPGNVHAARLDGGEFALLIPLRSVELYSPVTLIDEVRGGPMPPGAKVTVSVGIAEGAVSSEQDWMQLYQDAECALQRATRDGGGRFRMNMTRAVQ